MSANAPLAGPHRGRIRTDHHPEHPGHAWSREWAARFVAKWEGFLPEAYLDTLASPDVWTIGYGHTGNVHAGERWTHEHALQVLERDIAWAAAAVAEKVKHKLTVRQRMALISFVFNLGPGVLEGELLHLLNAGRIREAADKMLEYDHAGGVVVAGLLNRRRAERWMMLHPLHPRNPHRPPKHKGRKQR